MSINSSKGGKAAIAAGAAIGSAAIAGALLFATSRKRKSPTQPGPIPSGEKPETD
ncbi:isopropylmalate isomerase [Erythrobacter sp. LQ02-29]|uniref:isopropylmalate isomerase n=1 Tax=Erythrobacter sp. LQ02-29 TaxID=2920384 RepID=UPI001F4EE74E|nr:isopropylmalate isomerase [Erythrobacter sp. LQ02-29]MCP9222258.1 isopropylmalate isomerase [Erythrobacter sp. LQ02-29]